MTKIKSLFLALLAVGFLASCANDAAADEARNSLTADVAETVNTPETVTPTPNAKPAEPAAPVGPTTTVSYEATEFDFGTIDQGEIVEHAYSFTNTGSEPLIISNAKGSCGCTVPDWPKEPIAPGASADIKVRFDSKGKKNKQNKKVTITANTEPAQTFIYLKGEVNAPEGEAKPTPAAPAKQ